MKSVWITRTRPGADATAERVRALGHDAVTAPLLAVRAALQAVVDLTDVTLLAFTSANGVRAFAADSDERTLPVHPVGGSTAAAARAAGFADVRSADGDVAALAALIIARRPSGIVLHPGGVDQAGDLTGTLRSANIDARSAALYETVICAADDALLARLGSLDAVLLHSPKAARALAAQLGRTPSPGLHILCLSPHIAVSFGEGLGLGQAGAHRVSVAASPDDTALLSLLQV